MFRCRLLPAAFVLLLLLGLNGRTLPDRTPASRRLTLWAWERPEQLTFLPSHDVGVAFLAGTIELSQTPILRPRFQPLHVAPKTPLTAVIRLQTTSRTPPTISDPYRADVVRQILRTTNYPGLQALQIDFDSTRSQRPFYRELLRDLRGGMPAGMPLSITALGSWCLGDDWIADLPIDEAVPMLFRMGADRTNILEALSSGSDFREPLCRSSIGLSLDEPWPERFLERRMYLFNPRPWDAASYARIERRLQP